MQPKSSAEIGVTVLILMYHHVAVPDPAVRVRGLYVTPQQFDGQLGYLKKAGYEFTNFKKLQRASALAEPAPSRKLVMLTFDDGYLDNYQYAFPLLKKYQATAVIYPVVGDIGKTAVVWPENAEQFPAQLMHREAMREMQQAGIEFGSHLWEHVHLVSRPPLEVTRQLKDSKAQLEKILEEEVLSVAYPFGSYDQTVLRLTKDSGYHYGVTTVSGINTPADSKLELKRLPVKGHKWYHPWQFSRHIKTHTKFRLKDDEER